MDGWMYKRLDGCMDGWMEGWTPAASTAPSFQKNASTAAFLHDNRASPAQPVKRDLEEAVEERAVCSS